MKKAAKFIENLDAVIAGTGLVAIVLMTVSGVFMRKVMGKPFAWLEEMQIFFFVWTIYFGGSVAFRTGNQVSIDLIAARLKPGARHILNIIDYVITMVVLFYLTYGGYHLMASVTKKVTPYFKISYSLIDLAVPIGCLLMVIQYTVSAWKALVSKPEQIKQEGEKI